MQSWLPAALIVTAAGACAHGDHDHHAGAQRHEQTRWGVDADARSATRTIEVVMGDDMRFHPDRLDVRQGETVKIVVKNDGAMLHEFVLGDQRTLDEHAALMLKFPNMEHDEPSMAHVKPGAAGEIVWRFNRPGTFAFACLVPGHYQAGMVGRITVRAAPAARHRPAPG